MGQTILYRLFGLGQIPKKFAAFNVFRPLIYVPLAHEKFSELHCSILDNGVLSVKFDASAFNEKWSGTIECRFKTDKARAFLLQLNRNAG